MTVSVRPVEAKDRPDWERLFASYGVCYETAFDADVLAYALQILDASQIALELRGGPKG